MAQRLSKKKQPKREVKQLKERDLIESGVFDRKTLMVLYGFLNKRYLESVDFPISTGKEADVFRATAGPKLKDKYKYVAVKIFRIETTGFIQMQDYLLADPRFSKVKRSKRQLIFAWCSKEFRNLKICEEAGVPAPKPIAFKDNVLLMEFLGDENGTPDPTLQQVGSTHPKRDFKLLLGYVKKLYKKGFVHADLSEFNIIMHGYPDRKPYLIDIGQGVVLGHPKSKDFLDRDLANLCKCFGSYGINTNAKGVC